MSKVQNMINKQMKIDDNKLASNLSDLRHCNEWSCSAEVTLKLLTLVLGLERLFEYNDGESVFCTML